ncbi:MAG: hypothetical protein PSN37_03035 [Alphaproteobacteria bacterium]|nr:hypothetical protein [Alphaproteobacteria bacterium]
MKIYSVYQWPCTSNVSGELVFVKEGFSWLFFFPSSLLLYVFLMNSAFKYLIWEYDLFYLSLSACLFLSCLLSCKVSLFYQKYLLYLGYAFVDMFVAENKKMAEVLFFFEVASSSSSSSSSSPFCEDIPEEISLPERYRMPIGLSGFRIGKLGA